MENKNIVVLEKMKNYAKNAIDFTKEMTFEEFLEDRKTIDASVFNMSQIGELVKLIDENTKEKYKNINWIAIKNLRNKIVHDYDGLQFKLIWSIINNNLPQLIEDINFIVENEK